MATSVHTIDILQYTPILVYHLVQYEGTLQRPGMNESIMYRERVVQTWDKLSTLGQCTYNMWTEEASKENLSGRAT